MERFKLMTFNIRGCFSEAEARNLWENRAECNVQLIQRYDPDLIGFQEVQVPNEQTYAQHLPMYHTRPGITASTEKKAGWLMHNPIYWKQFEKVQCGGFFLSPTPHVWSKGWDAAYVRSATWAIFHTANRAFLYINAHFDHIGEQARVESAKLIVQQAQAIGGDLPIIITADFNSRAWAPPNEDTLDYPPPIVREYLPPANTVYDVFMQAGFRDAYLEAGHINQLDTNTYHGFIGQQFPPVALRIDWILVRDGRFPIHVEDCDIIRDHNGDIYPSDHYPVMAHLAI
ncbi:MAG: endonuclease/exonuclease/phosphatase family protein [Chloroflexi bacterium]|nr:MAG: endonuclease/exonuclease/phosphatase family protein [Chloroflexota bacterium]